MSNEVMGLNLWKRDCVEQNERNHAGNVRAIGPSVVCPPLHQHVACDELGFAHLFVWFEIVAKEADSAYSPRVRFRDQSKISPGYIPEIIALSGLRHR